MLCRLIRNRTQPILLPAPVVATLGSLDGLHRGHQALFGALRDARSRLSTASRGVGTTIAITLYPHPDKVLGKQQDVALLSGLRLKLDLLSQFGVDFLVLLHFTKQFARLGAEEFIERELFQKLGVDHLVIGPDARLGHRREGSPEVIVQHFEAAGRSAEIVPFFEVGGERVSSNRIRSILTQGLLDEARALLGRSYSVEGHVCRGDGRGKSIGVPTANLDTKELALPKFGVYAGFFQVLRGRGDAPSGKQAAVCNVGLRPTFGGNTPSVEVHLLDYQGPDFYGARVRFSFEYYVRGEVAFGSPRELVDQIGRDVTSARALLAAGKVVSTC